ncbi:hypothetical protein ACJMK2_043069 [Sinanodonta woodiana]|uniref:Peptidase A2 domain-containing protein n=1 Tax=Sinanodonta woodiana TaxID=1069815 RepID=A0ABD3VVT8_SINWO
MVNRAGCNPVALEFLTMDQDCTYQAECKEVQGREVNFLIDTGANVTIINSSIYEQMSDLQKPYSEPASQQMKMAEGKCIQTRGVGNMDITIYDTEVKHAVLVAEIDKAIDGILGFDFLQRNQCHRCWDFYI